MYKYEFSIILSVYFANLILLTHSMACFPDAICSGIMQQDESEENENSTGIDMHELKLSGMFLVSTMGG